jgi:hypothetical protein
MRRRILLVALFFAIPAFAGQGWYLLSPPKIPGVMEFDEKAPHWSDGNITVRLIQQKIVSGT